MTSPTYYRATCGSIYRVRTVLATRTQRAGTYQVRRSPHAPDFSPEYETSPAKVQRLVAIGSFVQVPAP